MRIVCQSCSSAYAVEDRLIGTRGVRTQCPKCRHLQTVRKDPAAVSVPTAMPIPAPPKAARLPQADEVAPSPLSQPVVSLAPVTLPPPVVSVPPLVSVPPAALRSEVELASQRAPRGAGELSNGETARPGDSPGGERAEAPPATAVSACRDCGITLTDPFDQALNACDACRAKAGEQVPADPPPDADFGAPLEDPFASERFGGSGEEGLLELASAPDLRPAPPPPAARRPAPLARASTARTAEATTPPAPTGEQRKLKVLAGIVIGTLALGGGLAVVGGKSGGGQGASDTLSAQRFVIPAPLQASLTRWAKTHAAIVDGEASVWISRGEAALSRDRASESREAQRAFELALLRDPASAQALVGYVRAFSWVDSTHVDDLAWSEALALADLAVARTARAPASLIAKASLLLVRSHVPANAEQARALADEAVRTAAPDTLAAAHLVLGRALLQSATALAIEQFDAALRLDPGLAQALYYRALAHEAGGHLRLAAADLQKRLSLDPEHDQAALALARLYVRTGQGSRARELLSSLVSRASRPLQARLALAMLRSQVRGERPAEAVRLLRGALKTRDAQPIDEQVRYLVALAEAERVSGNPADAQKVLAEALTLAPDDLAAHVQGFLLALARNDAPAAATHSARLQGRLRDGALEKLLLGRTRVLEGRFGEATVLFREAHAEDPRRLDALIWAGVAAVKADQSNLGYRLLYQALLSDPSELAPQELLSPLRISPRELLLGAEGQLASRGDVAAHLYEGLIHFHLGQSAEADRWFVRALAEDTVNPSAFVYRSLLAAGRGDALSASRFADKAVASGRQLANAHFVKGQVLATKGQRAAAERALREALTLAPGHVGAMTTLASIESKRAPEEARVRLIRALNLDHSRSQVKTALYALPAKVSP